MTDTDNPHLSRMSEVLGRPSISFTPTAFIMPTATAALAPVIGADYGVHEKRKPLPVGARVGIAIGAFALVLLLSYIAKRLGWMEKHFKKKVARDMENAGADATEEQKEAWRKAREGDGIRAKMLRRNDEILRKRYEQEERAERERLEASGAVLEMRAEMAVVRAEREAAERSGVEGTDRAAMAERHWVLHGQREEEEREREREQEIARAEETLSVAEGGRRAAMAEEYAPPPPYAPK